MHATLTHQYNKQQQKQTRLMALAQDYPGEPIPER